MIRSRIDQWGTGNSGFTGVRWFGTGSGNAWAQETTFDGWGNLSAILTSGVGVVMRKVMQNFCGGTSVTVTKSSYIVSQGEVYIQLPSICSSVSTNRTMLSISGSSAFIGSKGDGIQLGGSGTSSSGLSIDSTARAVWQSGAAIGNTISGGGFAVNNSGTMRAKDVNISGGTGTGVINQSGSSFFDDSATP